jgi:hypothetical protein
MGAGELECFKKKNNFNPPPPTMACGFVALQSPCPQGGAVVHGGSSMGAGGLKCFKKNKKKIQKNFNPPPSPDRAVVHDGSSMGAGGLECNRAINQIFIYLFIFAWNISIPAEAWGIMQVPSTEQRDLLEHGGKEVSSRS